MYEFWLSVPPRLRSRWSKHVRRQGGNVSFQYKFSLSKMLRMTNVTSDEFAKCWEFVKKNTTHEDIFRLLKEAGFGHRYAALFTKLNFVRKVVQRCKDEKVFVVYMFQQCRFYWVRIYEYACLCTHFFLRC